MVSYNLPTKIVDCHAYSDDERDEGQLKGIPSLETEDTQSERNQGHGLEKDDDHYWP